MNARMRVAVLLILLGVCSGSSILRAQSFGFSAGAGMSFPIQEFSDTYTSGLTSQIVGEYNLMGSITLVVATGYTVWPVKTDAGTALLKDAQLPGSLSLGGEVRNVPVSIGVRYYRLGSFGHSFLGLATGTNLMKGTADAMYDPQDGSPIVSTSVSESWSSTGFTIEAGTGFSLDDSWGVLVVLSYASILDLKHELIPQSQGIPISAKPPQSRTLGVTVGIQFR